MKMKIQNFSSLFITNLMSFNVLSRKAKMKCGKWDLLILDEQWELQKVGTEKLNSREMKLYHWNSRYFSTIHYFNDDGSFQKNFSHFPLELYFLRIILLSSRRADDKNWLPTYHHHLKERRKRRLFHKFSVAQVSTCYLPSNQFCLIFFFVII